MRFNIFIEKCLIIGMMSVFLLLAGCGNKKTKRMVVSATAYTSVASQTHKDHPTTNDKEAAMQWGKRKVTITWQVEAQ